MYGQIIDTFSRYTVNTCTTATQLQHHLLSVHRAVKVLTKPLFVYKIYSDVELYKLSIFIKFPDFIMTLKETFTGIELAQPERKISWAFVTVQKMFN